MTVSTSIKELKTIQINDLDDILSLNETQANIIIFNIPIIPQEICKDNKNVNYIIFTNEVQCIGACAFKNCENLQIVYFGKNLRRIENFCFQDCVSLDCNIILPPTMLSIGIGAFSNCFNSKDLNETREESGCAAMQDTKVKNLLYYEKDALVFQTSDKDKLYGLHFQNVDIYNNFHKLKRCSDISTQEHLGFLLQGFVIDTYEKLEQTKKASFIKISSE